MQTHSLPEGANWLQNELTADSCLYWARAGARKCVIFVHGYGGHALKTWGEFAQLAVSDPAFAEADLLFLGYESRANTAAYSTSVLFRAIDRFLSRPVPLDVAGPKRSRNLEYEKIILVGHSLGGVLVRDIAVNSGSAGRPWSNKIRLVLFAPAHTGAKILKLAGLGFGFLPAWGAVKALAITLSPVLDDLEQNSQYLSGLMARAAKLGKCPASTAVFVAHASDDDVVYHNQFSADDPMSEPYGQVGHIGCCKPMRVKFLNPLVDLGRFL